MTPDTSPAADLLRSAVGRVGLASATDGELVRRYADHRDDLAFAELVHRFAPAVYALCRRHLSDPGSADDAFQAVFVLLARKAGTLVDPDRVGGWLTGTADRVARTARRRHLRRSDRLRPLDSVPEPSSEAPPPSDLRFILDDELAKLPPHYRAVVMLCDVDGVSRREAAARLNIPTATLGNRLTRARAVLGRRLLRRGVLVAAGALVSAGSVANPPSHLLASAVRVALSDSLPTELLPLLSPEMMPMPRGKLLLLLVTGLVLAGGVTTGVVLLTQQPNAPATSEGEPAKATQTHTPATFAMSQADVDKMPQPKPRLPREDNLRAWAFSADGKWLVRSPDWWGQNAKVVVYDVATWKEAAVIDAKSLATDWSPWSAALSPDGKRLFLSLVGTPSGVRVWDVSAGRFEDTRFDAGVETFSIKLKLSADGGVLAGFVSANRQRTHIQLWDANSGALLSTIQTGDDPLVRFTFTDDGKTLATIHFSGDIDHPVYSVVEWEVATGREKRRIDLRKAVGTDRGPPSGSSVAYTADGKQIIVGGGFTQPEVKPAEVSPKAIISNYPWSGSVWVIDRESGKRVKTLVDHHHDVVRELHLTADSKKLIVNPTLPSRWDRQFGGPVGTDEEFVELQQWDVATWELDWVKIVPTAERWKLWNGAAK